MIMALLAWFFLGGTAATSGAMLTAAGVADLQDAVVVQVADEERRERAIRTLEALGKEVARFEKAYGKSGRQLTRLYGEHADNRRDAALILDELNAEWERAQRRALDARFALREQLTETEWAALFSVH